MRKLMNVVGCSVVSLLVACTSAAVDGSDIGYGSYLQVLASGRVVVERDFSGTGFKPCTAQAAQLIRSVPALKGNLRCATEAAQTPLPFSFVTHIQKTPESDEVLPTAPFVTRTATSQLCATWRDAALRQEKTVIVKQNCTS